MTLVRTHRNEFPSYSSLFDDFFNTELGDWRRNNFSRSNTTLPKVNILEDNDRFIVQMAAPGMNKKDFDLNLDQNILTISSDKNEEARDENLTYSKKEFDYQAFQRSFTLPDSADGEKINAKYENGILAISIPKKEEAKPKPPKTIKIS
ncbi:Hsp20/alpha crystallin family protein [Fulvivirga sp. M361]|uniref:Hsp20/alpha crystallin family protein n=1 Tax=Fulvivirga sp. M361 TaxID=2594266 RepID=UPI00117B71F2|nr:Hsp20/alpha crystallin family protein [Fulvivirga sp. M361]TRX52032.1 Hsp20/alpha crystallin family protein [Fulvivirga sp. M361]